MDYIQLPTVVPCISLSRVGNIFWMWGLTQVCNITTIPHTLRHLGVRQLVWYMPGGGGTPYNGLYVVPFSGWRYIKGKGFGKLKYRNGLGKLSFWC